MYKCLLKSVNVYIEMKKSRLFYETSSMITVLYDNFCQSQRLRPVALEACRLSALASAHVSVLAPSWTACEANCGAVRAKKTNKTVVPEIFLKCIDWARDGRGSQPIFNQHVSFPNAVNVICYWVVAELPIENRTVQSNSTWSSNLTVLSIF